MTKMCLVRCIQISTAVAIVGLLITLTLLSGCLGFGGDAQSGASSPSAGSPQVPERPRMNLSAAAATLGVTEDVLRAALGDPALGPGNFTAAAEQLGVFEQELIDALGISKNGVGNGTMDGRPRMPLS